MQIKDKLFMDHNALHEYGPITIVAFGDSVTHGALTGGEYHFDTVYWNLLRKRLFEIRNDIPVNVINAGIAGTTARQSLSRLEAQVLTHRPDLVIVCFGLNDINGAIEDFLSSLQTIFEECKKNGADVIYMSPNMLNTYVAEDTPPGYEEYAAKLADFQSCGKMDLYIESAMKLANDNGVTVCDCYNEWKKLSKTKDTTLLLCNRMNHPCKEMHTLFADMLFDIIAKDIPRQKKTEK